MDEHFESYALLSYKTANSFSDIGKLEFWKFQNLLVHVNKIIESENGDEKQNPTSTFEDMQRQSRQTMSSGLSSMKSGMKFPKT